MWAVPLPRPASVCPEEACAGCDWPDALERSVDRAADDQDRREGPDQDGPIQQDAFGGIRRVRAWDESWRLGRGRGGGAGICKRGCALLAHGVISFQNVCDRGSPPSLALGRCEMLNQPSRGFQMRLRVTRAFVIADRALRCTGTAGPDVYPCQRKCADATEWGRPKISHLSALI